MPFRFFIGNIEIQCDTVAELTQAMADAQTLTPGSHPVDTRVTMPTPAESLPAKRVRKYPTAQGARKPNGQGEGPKASWAEAAERAAMTGESTFQARLTIAAEKRAAVAKALEKLK